MIRLRCNCQNYAWGKIGLSSEVAQLMLASSAINDETSANQEPVNIEENQPYAELWMGTHPKGPSMMAESGQLLSKWLGEHRDVLGSGFKAAPGDDGEIQLPFLLKVLSVNSALSIQVHPTKDQARVLHAADPTNYPDDNHKPEMAIALTPFEMLCGFRKPEEILQNLKEVPELFELVSSEAFSKLDNVVKNGLSADSSEARDALKACFSSLMKQPAVLVQKNLAVIIERVALQLNLQKSQEFVVRGELLIRLNYAYPGDVGCFAPFFLNHYVLQPGEASFLGPNEPHAYLYGDCIECMACSDNTIRAGLTPKFKDVARLCEMLTYRMQSAEANKFPAQPLAADPKHVVEYNPPVEEFAVHKITVASSDGEYHFPKLDTCSIAIVIAGEADILHDNDPKTLKKLSRGIIGLLPANTELKTRVTSSTPLVVYRAFPGKL